MPKYLLFNELSLRYKVATMTKKEANEVLRKLNQYRCGKHYIIAGIDNINAIQSLLKRFNKQTTKRSRGLC